MTLAELNTKTEDDLNVMLATLRGWEPLGEDWTPAVRKTHMGVPGKDLIASPPRYTASLDACAEVERGLPAGIRDVTYISTLARVCGFAMHGPEEWSRLHIGRSAVVTATARQRTIALILTLSDEPKS